MAEAVESAGSVGSALQRHRISRSRRRRDDRWIGISALAAALIALPLSQSAWHGPEVAAVLAVAATALLAGQRWAIAVIAIAELLLLPTVWPRAFLAGALVSRIAPLLAVVAIVPGLLALRRAAAALVLVSGWRRTGATCRRLHALMCLAGVAGLVLPLVL